MELTVEYRIGLAQPDTPKRYHAKNLCRGVSNGPSSVRARANERGSYFKGFGMFQTTMQMVEKSTQVVSML